MTGLIKRVMCQNEIEKNDWETWQLPSNKRKNLLYNLHLYQLFCLLLFIHASRNLLDLMR